MPEMREPVGYVTVVAKGLLGLQQPPLENVKVVAVCMERAQQQK